MSFNQQKLKFFVVFIVFTFFGVSWADEGHPPETQQGDDVHSHGRDPRYSLHFAHPLIAESPSPDTKARLCYVFRRIHDGTERAKQNTLQFEGEYAFHPRFSVEVNVPFTFLDSDNRSSVTNLDTVEVGLKTANFAFAEYGLLLGYGIEFGLPTGDNGKGTGSSNELEIEPFFDVGFKYHACELVGFASFGIPTNQKRGEEIENEFGFNASALYHITPRVMGLVELDGETVLNGEEDGETVVNVTPGVNFRPFESEDLHVGLGVSVPVSGRENFEFQSIVSVFYHF